MNKIVNRYLVQSTVLIAVLTLLSVVYVGAWGDADVMALPLCIVVGFQLVACLAYGLLWKSVAAKSKASLPTLYLTASGARMFAAVVTVLAFLFVSSDPVATKFFVIAFLVYYFLVLIYDTIYFVKVEKKIQLIGKIE